jgi:hypothetical protein
MFKLLLTGRITKQMCLDLILGFVTWYVLYFNNLNLLKRIVVTIIRFFVFLAFFFPVISCTHQQIITLPTVCRKIKVGCKRAGKTLCRIQYQFQIIQWPLTWTCSTLLLATNVWVVVGATAPQSVQWL